MPHDMADAVAVDCPAGLQVDTRVGRLSTWQYLSLHVL